MTVEATILFDLLIALICVWIAMVVNSKFLRPAILNKKRLAIYELRDQLAILAMSGVIEESSEEYVTLLRLMNNSINSTKDFRITRFLKMQSAIITDKRLRIHLDSILEKIEDEKMPDEYRKLVSDFFEAAREIYEHKTWMLRNILTPLILVLTFLAYGIRAARKAKNFLVYQKDRINNIEDELDNQVSKFAF